MEVRERLREEFAPKIQSVREEFNQNLEFNDDIEVLEDEFAREFIYPAEQ